MRPAAQFSLPDAEVKAIYRFEHREQTEVLCPAYLPSSLPIQQTVRSPLQLTSPSHLPTDMAKIAATQSTHSALRCGYIRNADPLCAENVVGLSFTEE